MSSSHNYSPFLAIIIRYHQPLERYARRLTRHKHRAPDIVKWALESLYSQGLNWAVEKYNQLQSKGAINSPGQPASEKPPTSQP